MTRSPLDLHALGLEARRLRARACGDSREQKKAESGDP
jgi:hypothetical protein